MKCERCGKQISEMKFCGRCYQSGWDSYIEMEEKYQQLKKILKGILEIAKVVE